MAYWIWSIFLLLVDAAAVIILYNPVNNFAKYSASEVWQSPEVLWETFNVNYTN